jgi:phosphopantothenoylcysteine synthetase/decarboxylase
LVIRKRILITAGPTWVAIDRVRVISNLASGETGFILASKLRKLGAKVTLLLGPGNFWGSTSGIKLIRFNYFSELKELLDRELKNGKYAAVIHAAAVADYKPKEATQHKVSSQRKSWKIELVPTPKLVKNLKKYQTDVLTVGFKFEPQTCKNRLLLRGRKLLQAANLDLVVANSNRNGGYQAYILGRVDMQGPFLTKTKMADYLSGLINNLVR